MRRVLEALDAAPGERLAFVDGQRRLPVAELRAAVGSEAQWLTRHGVTRCALLADNGCAWAIADLALLRAGLLNLPLPTFFTAAQRRHALDDAGIDAMLTDDPQAAVAQSPEFSVVDASPRSGLTLLRRAPPASLPVIARDVVKITYTSGSTGTPRGVCLTAATLDAVADSLATAVADAGVQRHLCLLPLSTLLENLTAVHVALRLGACSMLPGAQHTGLRYGGLDAQKLVAAIVAARPDSLVLVPELLRVLVGAAGEGRVPDTLRFVAVGGAHVPAALVAQARTLGLPVYEGYGLSECASVVCLNTPAANRPGSVGRPLPHVRVRVDAQGELHVAGAVMAGYLGDEPVRGAEMATGDLGEIDADGFVYVRGRRRNLFITSLGRNVSPEWVESELLLEPPLARALVVGEAQPYAAALVWPRPGMADAQLIDAAVQRANARLPDYAQVRRWALAPDSAQELATLLTANGRLRRDEASRRHHDRIQELYR